MGGMAYDLPCFGYVEIDIRFKEGTSLGISITTAGMDVRRVDLLG